MSENNRRGVLFVVSGPSGAGKGTICQELRARRPQLKISVSATTRVPRPGEIEGVHYFFRTKEEFLAMRERGEFLEWAEVYGNFYGTPVKYVRDALERGEDMLLEIDVQGALNVKKIFPEAAMVFVVPPSLEILKQRLSDRGTETPEALERRCAAARDELSTMMQYDYFVVNDDLKTAACQVDAILTAETRRVSRNEKAYQLLMEGKKL